MRTALPSDFRQHLHWETALDRLELDVMRAERMLDDATITGIESWDEPQLAGPIPPDLVERALEILERQERVQRVLAERLGELRAQHEFAERVDRATGRVRRPVYVDVEA
ncbi:MAG: hypothetical protein ACXVWZ_00615 [Nocardioides sp.]